MFILYVLKTLAINLFIFLPFHVLKKLAKFDVFVPNYAG